MQKFAHSVPDRTEEAWEPLSHHLEQVGRRAAGFAEVFGGAELARAMGLLHDIGKQSDAYQHYIRGGAGQNDRRGPDHSSAGAREAIAAYGDRIGKLMAFGIAGHHAGLMDGTRLAERRTKLLEDYSGWQSEVQDLPDLATVQAGLPRFSPNAIEKSFSAAFFIRMLFSCLVDADFLETEAFYASACNEPPPARGGVIGRAHVEATRRHMAAHRRDDNEVNRLRSAILDHAVGKAALVPGLFTLTVPTESPPARRRGSKLPHPPRPRPQIRRLPRGGVDRNVKAELAERYRDSRLPRGGVDRNRRPMPPPPTPGVASRAGAWIETRMGR